MDFENVPTLFFIIYLIFFSMEQDITLHKLQLIHHHFIIR
jgi:hypothetical protein